MHRLKQIKMVVVAQLVRASVCGTEGRGFESRLPPKNNSFSIREAFFVELTLLKNQKLNKLSMIFLMFYRSTCMRSS